MSIHHELNLALLPEAAYERHGDHDALVYDGQVHRFGELQERAARIGGALSRLGIRPGDRVVVLMANRPEVSVAYNAIWRSGAVVTPVMFLVTPGELAHILTDSGARAIITASGLLATVAAAAADAPDLQHLLLVDELPEEAAAGLPGTLTVSTFTDLEAADADADATGIVTRGNEELAALLYTGGTTGRAKGVMLSHRNLHTCSLAAYQAGEEPGLTDTINRTLVPLPLSHAYGLIVTLAGWQAPKPQLAVLQRWFDPAEWLTLAHEHRIQRTTLVPSMIQMLLGQPLENADLSELRLVNSGGAPLPYETRLAWQERLPHSRILEGYGLTESGSVVSATRPGHIRPDSVGRPLPGYAVEIRDDTDRALPAGSDGEICVRSAGVMSGYWHAPTLTARTLRDGWLYTGDIGHLDTDGFLYIVDRKKDLILRGGFNIFPRDIEDTLITHPSVAQAGVVGRPDPRLGEEVVAFVALHPGCRTDPAELIAYARDHLAAHKYPREIRVIDRLPLTSVGKLDRKALRAYAEQDRAPQDGSAVQQPAEGS
ncbi:class I adenylate-forming enzyme family protein [Streptomyces beijiangensis]|uniref:AMP-binding protein n=1 Tax=Streptomyces beijiangensis TaxID=163361 RepID=A0A939JEP6_9ACTN|nr:AMP-binding protein [Streptomyces beijiangensis]MBO0513286.1 AMP-binding protein [Streptomyces beijiangensis]